MDILKFAIGDEDEKNIANIRNILQLKGHLIACEEKDGPSLLRKIRGLSPDFVIVGYNIPGMKGLEIARIVENDRIAPTLLIADSSQDIFLREMGNESFAYIIKPISQMQLLGTIDFVYNNFKKLIDLEKEVLELKNMLEIRKAMEKAKGIIMDKYDMKEKDAFRYLQKRSMDECKPVFDIAKRIIENNKSK
jgi:two-component system, response regulator PdtaR